MRQRPPIKNIRNQGEAPRQRILNMYTPHLPSLPQGETGPLSDKKTLIVLQEATALTATIDQFLSALEMEEWDGEGMRR